MCGLTLVDSESGNLVRADQQKLNIEIYEPSSSKLKQLIFQRPRELHRRSQTTLSRANDN
jgi:hypothetical protein